MGYKYPIRGTLNRIENPQNMDEVIDLLAVIRKEYGNLDCTTYDFYLGDDGWNIELFVGGRDNA